ncbi:anti-sigma factor RsiW [Nonomuraea thailandensis]|uniref:Anti-sigma factor RsiW n=1 Tax=Nonomuraea thailandensis TaxID=1188745 RepID=A0A9X2K494_9ACTN|nr:zf-HC2 domain-containing protein [Nonomuraea thailandensis]MCP2360262.1 anti-sigma factor RsiW [Nonomuraea thailandensis]
MEEGSPGCAEVLALVTDYLDAALPPGRHRTVAGHLEACPGCSAWLAQLLATIAALGCLREGVVSPPVLAALRESFAGRGIRSDGGGARGRRT